MSDSENKISIELTRAQSLVLFEFLSRYSDEDKFIIDHPSEERVLWHLQCYLETILVEPFQDNYSILLEKAQKEIVKE